jgi:hypothetical protein
MTSISPSELIRYENYCQNERSTIDRSVQPADLPSLMPETNSRTPCSVNGFWDRTDFDDQIRVFENIARHQYLKILKSLAFKELPRRLEQMLDQNILPTLHRIGFDEPISKMLFEIAPSSWKLMGPVTENIVTFHPKINQEVEDVRKGLELKVGKNSDMFSQPAGAPPKVISGTLSDNIAPEHLFELLDDIATPWIILPRAFRFLKKNQSLYLPVYLKTIGRETRESCLKLFSRITVEFMGNYSLKFADRHHPPDQLTKLLFYGYSVLFWKTLRCPPENMENSAVFDNFFNWLSRLARKSDFLGNEENTSIDQMIKVKTMVFPTRNCNCPQNRGQPNISRFIVSLRHGCLGIATTLNYFGIDQFLETRQIVDRFPCPSLHKELHSLLHTIQSNYNLESKRTRGYIKQFIGGLRSAYELMQTDFIRTERKFLNRMFNNIQLLCNK